MSLKKNTISNYIGRFYLAFIGIIILPLYLKYLGDEAFGLVSLFAVMQAWLRILDMGLMPSLSREVAYYHNKENGYITIKQLVRTLEIMFLLLNVLIIFFLIFSSEWIAHHWLKIETLNYSEVSSCIVIMGVVISLHWISDIYRSAISGLEKQIQLNLVNILIVSLQYGGGYLILSSISNLPIHFFQYQLAISVVEFLILGALCYKMLPTSTSFWSLNIPSQLMKQVFTFAGGIAYTAILWTLFMELDKLLLSHILPLSKYGYFALVMMISGGVMQFSAPISEAILPRMTNLLSNGNKEEMLRLYKNATQLTALVVFPITGIIALYNNEIVYAWTGNKLAANWAGPILFWYVLANGVSAIAAFQYYLQYAYGELKLHVIMNTLTSLFAIPLIYFSAYHYGATGTGITRFFIAALGFFVLSPIIHRKYARGMHLGWLLRDILPILLIVVALLPLLKIISIDFEFMTRNESFLFFGVLAIVVGLLGALGSSKCRDYFLYWLARKE